MHRHLDSRYPVDIPMLHPGLAMILQLYLSPLLCPNASSDFQHRSLLVSLRTNVSAIR